MQTQQTWTTKNPDKPPTSLWLKLYSKFHIVDPNPHSKGFHDLSECLKSSYWKKTTIPRTVNYHNISWGNGTQFPYLDAQESVLEASWSSLPMKCNAQTKRALASILKEQNKIAKVWIIISDLLSEKICTDNKEWTVQLRVDIITSFPKFHMQIRNS